MFSVCLGSAVEPCGYHQLKQLSRLKMEKKVPPVETLASQWKLKGKDSRHYDTLLDR